MNKYFIYSKDQQSFSEYINSTIGKEYTPGRVLLDGEWKPFTQIAEDSSLRGYRYQDAEIVGYGNINNLDIVYPKSSYL